MEDVQNKTILHRKIARIFHRKILTLRYYDEFGILKLEYVDKDTNYCYYSTEQFERLNTLKYLLASDVPLVQIFNFFEEKDLNTMLSVFIEQRKNILSKQQQLAQKEVSSLIQS